MSKYYEHSRRRGAEAHATKACAAIALSSSRYRDTKDGTEAAPPSTYQRQPSARRNFSVYEKDEMTFYLLLYAMMAPALRGGPFDDEKRVRRWTVEYIEALKGEAC